MNYWAAQMSEHQGKADSNLAKARLAQADLDTTKASLASAMVAQATASDTYARTNDLVEQYKNQTPPPNVKLPAPWEVQRARNASASAQAAVAGANQQVATAQAALDAAKRFVADAKADYDTAARQTVKKIQSAKDAAVRADSWWESITQSDAWAVLIGVVTVVVAVLAIVALFTPLGPLLGALLLIGGALLLADEVAKFASGESSFGELMLGCVLCFIPGGKGVQAGLRGVQAGTHLIEAGAGGIRVVDKIAGTTRTITKADGQALPKNFKTILRGFDRGDTRDVAGKFTGKDIPSANKEGQGLSKFGKKFGVDPITTQVKASIPGREQGRFFDGLFEKADGTYGGIEVKSGSALEKYLAPSSKQRQFDNLICAENPAHAVLKGQQIKITSVHIQPMK